MSENNNVGAEKIGLEKKAKVANSGVPGLDDILIGGYPTGRTYLIEGYPGSGKTTLAMQFLMAGRDNGESCLYMTLSETKEELTQVAQSHGWNLDGIEIFELPSDGNLATATQSTFFHTSEVELSQTNKAMLEIVERIKPSRVVLDSLSELKLLTLDSVKFRRQVMALKHFFSSRGITVMLLDDRVATQKKQEIQSIVHGVISLEQLSPGYGAERRRMRVTKLRGVPFMGGYHDFSVRVGGLVVFPRLVASQHGEHPQAGFISSGISGLDQLWGDSLDSGTSTLLMGPAGAGKSTIAVKYAAEAARRGEKVALFLFDEGKQTLFQRCKALGICLEEHVTSGLITIRQVDPAEISPGELMMTVRESVEQHGCKMVVIDSLNGYINAMPEERFLVIHMHELLSYLRQMNTSTILVVAQHGLLGIAMESVIDVSYLADNVLLFRYFEVMGAVNQAISVVKRRGGRHERTIRELTFSDKGIQVGPALESFRGVLTGTPEYTLGGSMLGGSVSSGQKA